MEKRIKRKQNRINALSEAQTLAFAPLTFQALATMIDIGLLKLLDKHKASLEEIMSSLKVNEYIARTLLQVGCVINVFENIDNKYTLSAKGEAFLYDEMTIANFNFVKDICYLGASELTQSFLQEKPIGLQKFIEDKETIYPLLPNLPEPLKSSWYEFDNLYSDNCFDKIFEIISANFNKIFDIGGNTGKFEKICLKNKNIDITMLDLPENISARLKEKDLQGCNFYPVDVLKENIIYPDMSNSAILMSQFLDCFSKKQILKILTDLKNKINENSSIFILEPFTDNQSFEAAKYSLVHISLYFTCMANGVSKMYEQVEMQEITKKAGLKLVKVYNNIGPFDYTLLECKKDGMV
jgi:hypothetical protein